MQEWLKRALRTFLQAAVGCLVAGVAGAFTNGFDFTDSAAVKSAITGLLITAVATGLAAVMNLAKKDGIIEEWVENEDDVIVEDIEIDDTVEVIPEEAQG